MWDKTKAAICHSTVIWLGANAKRRLADGPSVLGRHATSILRSTIRAVGERGRCEIRVRDRWEPGTTRLSRVDSWGCHLRRARPPTPGSLFGGGALRPSNHPPVDHPRPADALDSSAPGHFGRPRRLLVVHRRAGNRPDMAWRSASAVGRGSAGTGRGPSVPPTGPGDREIPRRYRDDFPAGRLETVSVRFGSCIWCSPGSGSVISEDGRTESSSRWSQNCVSRRPIPPHCSWRPRPSRPRPEFDGRASSRADFDLSERFDGRVNESSRPLEVRRGVPPDRMRRRGHPHRRSDEDFRRQSRTHRLVPRPSGFRPRGGHLVGTVSPGSRDWPVRVSGLVSSRFLSFSPGWSTSIGHSGTGRNPPKSAITRFGDRWIICMYDSQSRRYGILTVTNGRFCRCTHPDKGFYP